VIVEEARAVDLPFLREMAYEAMYWDPGAPRPPVETAFEDDHLSRYVEGWGREGDAAVVARDAQARLGAAWYRLFRADRPGYGSVDERTPELGVAVRPRHRRRGVGERLLRAILEKADAEGYDAVSLSVSERNRAAMRLYERNGFERVTFDGSSWTMLRRRGAIPTSAGAQRRPRGGRSPRGDPSGPA
jgi:ribosomal protein S18 acetylase RimI-like enzyme